MNQKEKFIPIVLSVAIGILLQLLFIVSDSKDTPTRAVTRFAKAYFKADPALADYLCEESRTVDDMDVVTTYLAEKASDAAARGLGRFYLQEKLYNLHTYRVDGGDDVVKMRLTADIKPPLKSFFTKESPREFDHTFTLVNIDGTWQVCGDVFGELSQAL